MPGSRLHVLLAISMLTVPALAGIAAGAEGDPLVADAGDSRTTNSPGARLPVDGQALGGQAPYTYTWTIDGSTEPFADPHSAETTVDLPGSIGAIELTLEVTDADGATATDTVLYHVAEPGQPLLDRTVNLGTGVPDEAVGASGLADGQTRTIPFDVPEGTDRIQATLTWREGSAGLVVVYNDLDLTLLDPQGEDATGSEGRTGAHPERADVSQPEPGTWNARIESYLNAPEDARIVVTPYTSVELPIAYVAGAKIFGSLDDQVLHGEPGGPSGTTGAWDLDADGTFEATGTEVTLDRAPGEYQVRFQATTPDGFERTRQVTVRVTDDAEHAIPLHCGGKELRPTWTMEYSASEGTCWMHSGHNTYVLDEPVRLLGGVGWLRSVEQGLSPPTEYEQPASTTPVHLQASPDAQTWYELDSVEYDFASDVIAGERRQDITFEFTTDTVAEYFRIHEPRSAAQGLSGFLDRTVLTLLANETEADPTPPSPLEEGKVTFACSDGDVLEDFFPRHPCWFGGLNRYDAPSFIHTYNPGEGATVTTIQGEAQVAPWRTDDWFIPVVLTTDTDEAQAYAEQVTSTRVFVQTSPDGITWDTVDTIPLAFGEPTSFTTHLEEPHPARFIRLITDKHPSYDDFKSQPALHHPEAYLVHSELTLTGNLPTGS